MIYKVPVGWYFGAIGSEYLPQPECSCKEKEASDVRRYAACDFRRGARAVRRLLLASDARRSCSAAGLRARAGGCRCRKRRADRSGLPDLARPAQPDSRAELGKRRVALGPPLLSAPLSPPGLWGRAPA